ncbi:xylitol dehydrogenase [Moniliophthora roreri MCA 2997]|uniref:Xylitol dehydrogenase n=2 Tax=Moniliophthora roreri TaxID=221103 RepID=V2YWN2_MONRO|nr:xylitol dehydrogenase [Moniliophthora roreri MCA 2997]
MTDNPSFVLQAINNVSYEDRPIPDLSNDYDVIVEVKKTGICGSDVHYYAHGRIGDFVLEKPMVLGHESSGVVSKVGTKVKHVKPGDRVAIEPGASCGSCNDCKAGRYNLCPDMVFAATPPYDGTLARYYRVPGSLVYPLPDHVTLEDGAMMEPLSVGVHSVSNLGSFRPNQSIVVFGCGPVGLLCMAVAKAIGASRIIAVDIVPSRLDFAKEYAGADTYQPPPLAENEARMEYSRRNADNMKKTLGIEDRGPKAIDLVIDASGAEVSIQTALYVVKIGGAMVQVGMGNPNVTIDLGMLMVKELVFKGSFRYGPGDYALAIALVSQRKIDLKPLVTHRYTFKEAIEAFQATRAGKSGDGKGVIKAIISGPDVSVDDN